MRFARCLRHRWNCPLCASISDLRRKEHLPLIASLVSKRCCLSPRTVDSLLCLSDLNRAWLWHWCVVPHSLVYFYSSADCNWTKGFPLSVILIKQLILPLICFSFNWLQSQGTRPTLDFWTLLQSSFHALLSAMSLVLFSIADPQPDYHPSFQSSCLDLHDSVAFCWAVSLIHFQKESFRFRPTPSLWLT